MNIFSIKIGVYFVKRIVCVNGMHVPPHHYHVTRQTRSPARLIIGPQCDPSTKGVPLARWTTCCIFHMFPVIMNPVTAFELLFFAVFGQTTYDELTVKPRAPNVAPFRPLWTDTLFKVVFGIYMLVSVVVLINLLIAMMSDTYQRIQVTSLFFFVFFQSKRIQSVLLNYCVSRYSAKPRPTI